MKKLGGTLVGNSHNSKFNISLKQNLDTIIIPKIKKDGDEFFCVTGSEIDSNWDKSIEFILSNKDFSSCFVFRYRFIENSNTIPNINKKIKIVKITPELLKSNSIKNNSAFINDIKTWWGTVDRFLKIGCGFTALKGNEICGWSYSVCIADSRVEMYIETIENYRKQGIGTAIADRFVKHCLNNNLKPEWEAIDDIRPSLRIAEKVGFKFDYKYKLFEFNF